MKIKFIFSLFFAIISYFSIAQQQINTEFKTKTLQVFQNLDKNLVPHGILLDFGMEFTNLQAFNGSLTDSTYTNTQTLSDIYKTLLMSRVRSNVTTGFITPQEYATRWYSQRTQGVITLSGQYFKYNRFADNAYPSKVNYSNNQFSDRFIRGVWQNPYEEKQLFAMSPAISQFKGLTFQVKLPSNLFLTNYPATVQNIQVDFSDGLGYRTVAYDQLVNVTYTQANTYAWKYKITLTNGQTLLNHSKIEIEDGLNAVPYTSQNNIFATQAVSTTSNLSAYQKITIASTTPYGSGLFAYGNATVYIKYKNGGNTITKPLIVAEGFDTGVILSPEKEAGDNNIQTFLKSTLFNFSNSFTLENEINSYDIIYVDWNNGVDFIQKNAYVLEEVIKWVNTQKANNGSTFQNVVLGQSMGGLVARYALKDMENKGLNHDTRLYVSHDTPHLGANVPLSVQHSARHLRNMYINTPIPLLLGEVVLPIIFNFADGVIGIINGNTNWTVNGQPLQEVDYITPLTAFSVADTPASRQMQYNWVNRNHQLKNAIHDIWQQELATLGYPVGYPAQGKPIRNIAISNGSECGVTQIDNGNIMSYIKDAGRNTFFSNYIGIMDAVYGTLITNPLVVITALFPGNSYWQIDFQSKYMTTFNENKNIYHGSIKYKKKIFWFIPVSITITEKDVNQPIGVLPYDIYGGGNQKSPTDTVPLDNIVSNSFGFIPTASSLDIGKGTTMINDIDYRKSYVGALPPALPNNSPFQNFVTHFDQLNPNNNNSRHISFNRRNGNWLRAELNTGIADEYSNCSYMCSSNGLVGQNVICNNNNASFTVPSGATFYNWSVSQSTNLVTITGNGTPNIILTALPNVSGTIMLSLTMGDDPLNNNSGKCGNITLTKTIWVGVPKFNNLQPIGSQYGYDPSEPNLSISPDGDGCNQIRLNAVFDSPNILEYQWEKLTSSVAWSVSPNSGYIYIYPQCNQNFSFKVRTRNICGWSEWKEFEYALNRCTIDCNTSTPIINTGLNFILNPNPVTNDILNINVKYNAPWFIIPVNIGNGNNFDITNEFGESNYQLIPNISVNITIFNQLGVPVLQFPNTSVHPTPAELDVSSLQAGTYMVVFEYQGQVESYTIIKN